MGLRIKSGLVPLLILFALVLRVYFFIGPVRYDSLFYSEHSYNISVGTHKIGTDTWGMRYLLLLPASLLHTIFGFSEVTCVIFNLACSAGLIIITYLIARVLFGHGIGLISALLLATLPLDILYSTEFMPDLPQAFFLALSVYMFILLQRSRKGTYTILSGLALGIAQLIKETSFFILFFYLVYLMRKGLSRQVLVVLMVFAAVIGLESLFFYLVTSDPFYKYVQTRRFHTQQYFEVVRYNLTTQETLRNALIGYPAIMFNPMNNHFAYVSCFYYAFAAATIWMIWGRRFIPQSRLLYLWWVVLYLCIDLFPLQLYPYRPALVVHARYLVLLSCPAACIIGAFIGSLRVKKGVALTALIVVTGLTSTSLAYDYITSWYKGLKRVSPVLFQLQPGQLYTDPLSIGPLRLWSGYSGKWSFKEIKHHEQLGQIKSGYVLINEQAVWEQPRLRPMLKKIPGDWVLLHKAIFPARRGGNYSIRIYKVSGA
jgi:4-amino-4-deoxy-L-arabinose transferase-like glycosyltransferase